MKKRVIQYGIGKIFITINMDELPITVAPQTNDEIIKRVKIDGGQTTILEIPLVSTVGSVSGTLKISDDFNRELKITDFVVVLLDSDGKEINYSTVDYSGQFYISGLAPGRYTLRLDERFVNAGIFMSSRLPAYRFVSTHNKLNYIDTKEKGGEMCARLLFGLFALLNSTIYDRFVSIISKSKQINSKEMRELPLPPRNIIENIGMRLMASRQTTVAVCDQIVNPTLHIKEK